MRTLSILALTVAAIGFGARDAQAQGKYWPWCARYDGWTIVCGFATFQQCLATVSGVGGICQQNVMPLPVAEGVRYKASATRAGIVERTASSGFRKSKVPVQPLSPTGTP